VKPKIKAPVGATKELFTQLHETNISQNHATFLSHLEYKLNCSMTGATIKKKEILTINKITNLVLQNIAWFQIKSGQWNDEEFVRRSYFSRI
jgi:hypothetical protein